MYLNSSSNPTPGLYAGAVDLNSDNYADADKVIVIDADQNYIFTTANPGQVTVNGSLSYVIIQDCAVANTEYTIDVNTLLGHNGRGGFVKSKSSNTGEVSVCFSQDGTTFGTYIPDIQPGEAISLDGIDLDSIKVKSTIAGDDVIMEVH